MPSVCIVPVYVEVPSGFERAVATLESHLRRAGYNFRTGKPMLGTLEETETQLKRKLQTRDDGQIRARISP